MAETNLEEVAAKSFLSEAENDLRVALVMFRTNVKRDVAKRVLTECNFVVEKAVRVLNVSNS
jgi:N-acetylmuramic acid 6-phosphate (MurNAc-6-P) etherase